ncbi:MAG: DivIVA domain-containing protein [Solobacterium sp.]|nr:DivIVA domain-containing protein [Solobacterium sp.]
MAGQRPTFRVMRNGYDRFAVDDAIEKYAASIDQLENRILLYQNQLAEVMKQYEEMKARCQQLQQMEEARQQAADNIARLSLREANAIIDTAKRNADEIIQESLRTSRLILMDLSKLYRSAGEVKSGMYTQLEDLLKELDAFRLPEMPDLRWLDEAEKKLR